MEIKDKRKIKFYMIDNIVMERIKDPFAISVYNCVVYFCFGKGYCYPNIETIGSRCGISHPTTLKAIAKLIDLNFIKKEGKNKRSGNKYILNDVSEYKEVNSDSPSDINSSQSTKKIDVPPVVTPPRKAKFIPPTLQEVIDYCSKERKNQVDSQQFFDFYSVSNWADSFGNPVKNWKQKIITWEKRNKNIKNNQYQYRKPNPDHKTEEDRLKDEEWDRRPKMSLPMDEEDKKYDQWIEENKDV